MSIENGHQDGHRGKVAVVTGGGSGLGLACARRLAGQGFRVHALGKDLEINLETEPAAAGNDAAFSFTDFDVTDEAAVLAFASRLDGLDVLINAAGIILHDMAEYAPAGFRRVIDVNLNGSQLMAWSLHDHLKARKGCVVNFASMWSTFGSGRNPAYSASKGAVLQLTRSLAVGWAADGIRVNAVAPGWIKTRMSVNAMSDPVRAEPIMRRIPLGQWGEPEDIAAAVSFLVSPEARYVTGAMLPVDGGYSIS
ncbi:SDR family oxidoreductase [Xanthobacter sp. DSM 14520]|uniref:SDR family NAD(P)-dependent oxidoreductase n=1 Tax=Xanthobacter autotrophicus (strain ATCC BAA-1158 / Py2) TaxID=78245 RepID=UPI003728C32C